LFWAGRGPLFLVGLRPPPHRLQGAHTRLAHPRRPQCLPLVPPLRQSEVQEEEEASHSELRRRLVRISPPLQHAWYLGLYAAFQQCSLVLSGTLDKRAWSDACCHAYTAARRRTKLDMITAPCLERGQPVDGSTCSLGARCSVRRRSQCKCRIIWTAASPCGASLRAKHHKRHHRVWPGGCSQERSGGCLWPGRSCSGALWSAPGERPARAGLPGVRGAFCGFFCCTRCCSLLGSVPLWCRLCSRSRACAPLWWCFTSFGAWQQYCSLWRWRGLQHGRRVG
jgi:hypothetical protein